MPRAASASPSEAHLPRDATHRTDLNRATAVIHVITQALDFTRVLNAPCQVRSPHFAVHYLASHPAVHPRTVASRESDIAPPCNPELSTEKACVSAQSVDESAPTGFWLGLVVPKRHAKRAVTRTLLKRGIRTAVHSSSSRGLAPGMWVVRLRAPFPRTEFVSAASGRLKAAAADELASLMAAAVARAPR